MKIMLALNVDEMGDLDHSALVRFYEKVAKTEVKR